MIQTDPARAEVLKSIELRKQKYGYCAMCRECKRFKRTCPGIIADKGVGYILCREFEREKGS